MKKFPFIPGTAPSRQSPLGSKHSNYSTLAQNRQLNNAMRNSDKFVDLYCTLRMNKLSAKDEEKQEVQNKLKFIKTSYNRQKTAWNRRESAKARLRNEIRQVENTKTLKEFFVQKRDKKFKQLEERTKEVTQSQNYETEQTHIYEHMESRMNNSQLFLEMKLNKLKKELKNVTKELKDVKDKELKAKQTSLNAKSTLQKIEEKISNTMKLQQREVEELEVHMKNREIAEKKNQKTIKRQEELREQAMIDDRSSKTQDLRESMLLHRAWFHLIDIKFHQEQDKFLALEEALKKIKVNTGLSDIHLIVEKFLTKEQTYKSLMQAVKQKEKDVAKYKKKIDEMQEEVSIASVKPNLDQESELNQEAKHQLASQLKVVNELKEKKLGIKYSHNKVKKWFEKMLEKVKAVAEFEFNEELKEDMTLKGMVETVKKHVSQVLKNIQENKDEVRIQVDKERSLKIENIIEDIPMQRRFKTSPTHSGRSSLKDSNSPDPYLKV